MTRKLALGLILPCLAACGTHYEPVKSIPRPADVPDAALVAPCDTSERDPATNGDLADELALTRHQRDDCAAKVDGTAQWRQDAIRRAEQAASK